MLIYTIDRTLDGVLSAVFDAFSLRQQPDALVGKGEPLPLFCDEVHEVMTADDRAQRVWTGLEKRLKCQNCTHLYLIIYVRCFVNQKEPEVSNGTFLTPMC